MDFNTIITIGIIIYVIFSIKKALSSGKKAAPNQKKSGWAGKLGDVINNIKDEIEKANQEAMAGKSSEPEAGGENDSFWEEIREPAPEKPETSSKTINQTLFYETETKTATIKQPKNQKKVTISPNLEGSHRNFHGTRDMLEPVNKKNKKVSNCLNNKKADLRNAIIWSEIISKPVSMREQP